MKRIIMMPSAILKWKGELVEVIGISEGKVIHMRPVNEKPCEHCGKIKQYDVLENSPLFQENAEAVNTLFVPKSIFKANS